jgi:hypothetical protein
LIFLTHLQAIILFITSKEKYRYGIFSSKSSVYVKMSGENKTKKGILNITGFKIHIAWEKKIDLQDH